MAEVKVRLLEGADDEVCSLWENERGQHSAQYEVARSADVTGTYLGVEDMDATVTVYKYACHEHLVDRCNQMLAIDAAAMLEGMRSGQ